MTKLYVCSHKQYGVSCHSKTCLHNKPHTQNSTCIRNDACGRCHGHFTPTNIKINAKHCGYAGMILLISAYFAINANMIQINSYEYQICNLLAGILLFIGAIGNKPFMILNAFWSIVAIWQIVRLVVK